MADFLDVTSLAHFTSIFVFIFTMVVIYASLLMVHAFGSNKVIHIIISFLVAIFVVMSKTMVSLIAGVAPFIGVLFLFVVFLNIAMKMMGSDLESFQSIKAVFLIFVIIGIMVYAGMKARDSLSEQEEAGTLSRSMSLLFNAKFIGMILLFAIAIFTVALLASGGGHSHGGGGH